MSGWTDRRVDRLCTLWKDGLSARQVAAELGGGVTRNAIIGKVHRLGLAQRTDPPAVERSRQPPAKALAPSKLPKLAMMNPAAPRVPPEKALAPLALVVAPIASLPASAAADEVAISTTVRVALLELRDLMCRWPIGDPRSGDFGFCGAKAPGARPYCGRHAQVAYEPAQDRRRAREQAKRARAA
jgi:GcrA cell cycle regulator